MLGTEVNANPCCRALYPVIYGGVLFIEHSLIANKKQEVGVNCAQNECNACTSSSDAFTEIGQALCPILT